MAGVASLMGSVLQVNLSNTMCCQYCSHLLLYSTTMCWVIRITSHRTFFCFQAALSIFGMISGPLLGLYLLGMLFRTPNSIVSTSCLEHSLACLHHLSTQRKLYKCVTSRKYLTAVYFAGKPYGNDHRSSVDSVGGDWSPDLPTDSWKDKSSPTQHCRVQQHNGRAQHNTSSMDHSSDSDPTAWVSQITYINIHQ